MNHVRNINTIRLMAVEMVEKANSGHPGLPLGAAPMAYALWTDHLRFDPKRPSWPGRDRFVLSAGHGSALLYAMLHLFGYEDMTAEQLARFRQFGSITPGHPEYGHTSGVEVTTGPLGQGISNAVGIALAERHVASALNREDFPVVDFHTYVIASDGDLMEGISSEASSLAGHLALNKLIVLYDDNKISIDGPTSLAFTEDVAMRYRAYGWNVETVEDGNDYEAISAAIARCKEVADRPSLIRIRTIIGFGAPHKAGSAEVHGSPLGAEELKGVKLAFGFDCDQPCVAEPEAKAYFESFTERGRKMREDYDEMIARYRAAFPDLAALYDAWLERKLPENLSELLPRFTVGEGMATRAASGKVLDAISTAMPWLIGGSADLTPSNNTKFKGSTDLEPGAYEGRYIHYGVREHAMGAIMNGMAVTGLRPYGGTFLCFSDYLRPAIRLAALSGYQSIFVFTHDSIGLGEDGPTHQPVEHYAALRCIPNLLFIRPADANETAFAWQLALERTEGPTALALTRQKVPTLGNTAAGGTLRGAYVLRDVDEPKLILAATGSEVHLVAEAAEVLAAQHGIPTRVVSMPCWSLFEEQGEEYMEEVFPYGIPVFAVEAGTSFGWSRYADDMISLDHFGASGPDSVVMKAFGFTVENVVSRAMDLVELVLGTDDFDNEQ
jgi:transketolase